MALEAIGTRKKRKQDEALEGSSTSTAVSKTNLFTIKKVQKSNNLLTDSLGFLLIPVLGIVQNIKDNFSY